MTGSHQLRSRDIGGFVSCGASAIPAGSQTAEASTTGHSRCSRVDCLSCHGYRRNCNNMARGRHDHVPVTQPGALGLPDCAISEQRQRSIVRPYRNCHDPRTTR